MGRTGILVGGLATAVMLPYLMSPSTDLRKWLTNTSAEERDSAAVASATSTETSSSMAQPSSAAQPTPAPRPEGAPVQSFAEIFRFDVPPSWVLGRWPRVTTRLATLDLQGYRVALVTGTKEGDLAGSLTYYFNPQQQVQRITFIGRTGDSTPLVGFLEARYGFQRQVTPDPHLALYQVRAWRKTTSEMRIRAVSTVNNADPHGRFEVALVIERPG